MAEDPRGVSPGEAVHGLADTQLGKAGFVSPDERATLGQLSLRVRSIKAGDVLVRQGSTPDTLYFLVTGWAYRYTTTRGGGRQITALLVPGGVCNLDNLMFRRADFGVRALTAAKVLVLPRERALSLAAELPGVGRAFTWLALAENAILSQWAVGLGRRSAPQRLAHFLCEMHSRVGRDDSFELPLSQELIADALGLTPVHVNRTMQRLRGQGLIATSGRTITIRDAGGLCALAEFDGGYLDQIEGSAAVPPLVPG